MRAEKLQGFDLTYATYKNLMYHVAYGVLHNESDAEDAVADAFFKIYRNYSCVKEAVSAQTKRFVVVVTERTALNYIRTRKHIMDVPDGAIEQFGGTGGLSDEVLDVWLALQKLPADNQTAIILSAYCGLTAKEAAAVMGYSESKVKKLISRGKEKIKGYLEV